MKLTKSQKKLLSYLPRAPRGKKIEKWMYSHTIASLVTKGAIFITAQGKLCKTAQGEFLETFDRTYLAVLHDTSLTRKKVIKHK